MPISCFGYTTTVKQSETITPLLPKALGGCLEKEAPGGGSIVEFVKHHEFAYLRYHYLRTRRLLTVRWTSVLQTLHSVPVSTTYSRLQ